MVGFKPEPSVVDVQAEYNKRKKDFEEAFQKFHTEVFLSKVLDQNKSTAAKNTETHIVDRMMNTAVALDQVNVGEGLLALATVAIREMLTIRDRANELEYELYKALREMKAIQRKLEQKDGKEKQ